MDTLNRELPLADQTNEGYVVDALEAARLLGINRSRLSQLTGKGIFSFQRRKELGGSGKPKHYYRRSELLAYARTQMEGGEAHVQTRSAPTEGVPWVAGAAASPRLSQDGGTRGGREPLPSTTPAPLWSLKPPVSPLGLQHPPLHQVAREEGWQQRWAHLEEYVRILGEKVENLNHVLASVENQVARLARLQAKNNTITDNFASFSPWNSLGTLKKELGLELAKTPGKKATNPVLRRCKPTKARALGRRPW